MVKWSDPSVISRLCTKNTCLLFLYRDIYGVNTEHEIGRVVNHHDTWFEVEWKVLSRQSGCPGLKFYDIYSRARSNDDVLYARLCTSPGKIFDSVEDNHDFAWAYTPIER